MAAESLRIILRNIFVQDLHLSMFEEDMKRYVLFASRELSFLATLESLAIQSPGLANLLADIFTLKEANFSITSPTFMETVELLLTGSGKYSFFCKLFLIKQFTLVSDSRVMDAAGGS